MLMAVPVDSAQCKKPPFVDDDVDPAMLQLEALHTLLLVLPLPLPQVF